MKLWGTAGIVEDDAALVQALMPANYRAQPEQALVFRLSAWDANCPQHIPKRVASVEMAEALQAKDRMIGSLNERVAELTQRLVACGGEIT